MDVVVKALVKIIELKLDKAEKELLDVVDDDDAIDLSYLEGIVEGIQGCLAALHEVEKNIETKAFPFDIDLYT